MKKVITILIIAIIGVFLFWNKNNDSSPVIKTSTTSQGHPDPGSATFTFDTGEITLSKGRSERPIAPNSAIKEEVVLLEEMAYGDLNNDVKEDTVAFLLRQGGGSGAFIYLVAYYSGLVNYSGSEALFIGDRISPQSIDIKNGVVTITYLTRDESEPYTAEPNVHITRNFILINGAFVER